MAQDVNVFIGDFVKTGSKVQVDQWRTTFTVNWLDANGIRQTRTDNVTFPNDLALVPADWLKDALVDLMTKAAFQRLGVNNG